MSEVVGEAVLELRGDDRRLKSDIRRAGKDAGTQFGDTFDKESKSRISKSFRDSMLTAAKRATGVLTVAGLIGPAILAIGSAASAAVAGITAIGGALGPALIAGGAAAAGALLAVQSAIAVTKVAFSGLDKAIEGDAEALASLGPAGRSFASTLKGLQPRLEGIKRAVQEGLFTRLEPATQRLASTYFPLLRREGASLGDTLGRLAQQGARMVTSGPWRRDFATVAQANTRNVSLFGRAGLQLGDSFRSLLVTAQPLIRTFARFTLDASKQVNAFVQAKRASGDLAAFWDRAADTGAQLGRILGNLAVGLFNIFRIGGAGAGKTMLTNLEGITAQFREWTRSTAGIESINEFFVTGRRNLAAFGSLLGAASTGLVGLGSGEQLAPLIDQIRTELLPPVLEFLRNANVSGALSSLVSALASLARVFALLSENDASLLAFTETLRAVADAAVFLMQHVPGLTQALGALFTVIGVRAALGLVGLGGAVTAVGTAIGGLGTRIAVANGLMAANTGAVAGNTLAYRLSMSTMGTWIGVKALEARAWVGSTAAARGASAVLGTTAGKLGAAGVGIAGVAASAQSGSKAIGALGGAASGAIAGAALGSFVPGVGTVIGGVIGGLSGATIGFLKAGDAAKSAGASARGSLPAWQSYASTLDQVTGAITRMTREKAYDDARSKGLLQTTRQLGLTDRQAVSAIAGQGRERKLLTATVADQINITKAGIAVQQHASQTGSLARRKEAGERLTTLKAQLKNYNALQKELGILPKAISETKARARAVQQFSGAINKLPKSLTLQLRERGLATTRGALVQIQRQHKLTPKQLAILIREQGGTPTKKQIQGIIRDAKELNRQHPTPKVTLQGAQAARNAALAVTNAINNIPLFRTATVYTKRVGLAGARAAGGPVDAGRTYLVGERGPELVTFDQNAYVHDALTTARAMATGARDGGKTKKRAKSFGQQVVLALAAGIKAGAPKILQALTTVQNNIGKLDLGKKLKPRIASLLKLYADAGTRLKTLQDNIKQFRADFTSSFTSSVSLVGGDAKDILDNFTFQAGQTKEFLNGLASLSKAGLNSTLLGQLKDAGVSALPQVQALLAGGKDTITGLNKQTADLRAVAAKSGAQVSETMFGNGVQMASSLVKGLQSQQGALVKQMETLAAVIINALRRKMRMHSPSVPLVEIGRMAGHSVALGIRGQEASVAEASRLLAAAAIKGSSGMGLAPPPRPITGTPGAVPGLGSAPQMTNHITLPTGDPEAAAQAIWTRWVAAVVTG